MQRRAFKRYTIEFLHEVDGKTKPESMDIVRECNSTAYGQGVMESLVLSLLKETGIVNPRVVSIYQRITEPPMFLI